jgi:FkbM family methyltransferase
MSRLLRSLTYRLTGLLTRHLLRPVTGQVAYQPLFDQLHQLALRGLNYGAWDFRANGERAAAQHVRACLAHAYAHVPDQPWVLVDVGGNVGDYAEQLLGIMAPHPVQLHILEPSASCQAGLAAKFAGQPQVRLHALGLGQASGPGQLYYDHAQSGLASVYRRGGAHLGFQLDQAEPILLTTLDEFCVAQGLVHLHFVKLDIEGHELAALHGAAGLLDRGAIDFVQFEFGGANLDSRTQLRDFLALLQPQYSIFRVAKDGLVPVAAYRETDEIALTINFLAQRNGLAG